MMNYKNVCETVFYATGKIYEMGRKRVCRESPQNLVQCGSSETVTRHL